jgi:serine/threonine protein kinase
MSKRTAEEIFLDLSGHTGAGREAFLNAECAGDTQLREEVERLEQSVAAADNALRGVIGAEAGRVEVRRRIGPYELVRKIGHGGMGTVYLATRVDAEYEKAVAIKVARISLANDESQNRFRHERQILATLEHPNIARLLEGGTTPDGEPYIVMEYIDGTAIVDYARALNLPLAAQLRLFLKVAAAVEHAHRHLIVHRDLKPSNILVTPDGEPKLLDFGIAKILGPSIEPAMTTAPLMTPAYSSPEQREGRPVTVATDVYSLALVLGDMLAGRPLPADIESVIAKALMPELNRRYGSVRDFAADIERFLDGRPVEARPASSAYRLGKFLNRHRAGTAMTAALLLSVAGGWFATIRESRRTELRLAQVRQLSNTILFDLHDRIRALPDSIEARIHLVSTAQKYMASLEDDANTNPAVAAEVAAGYERLGDLQGGVEVANIGRVGVAIESYRKALALREQHTRTEDPAALASLATIRIKTANALAQRGASAEALILLRNAVDAASRAAAIDPANANVLIDAQYRLADWLLRKGRAREAVPHTRSGVDAARYLLRYKPGPASQRILWTALRRHGDANHQSGLLDEALANFAEAAALARSGGEPAPRESMLLTLAQGNVAGNPLFINLGDTTRAERHYREAVAWTKQQADADPKNVAARSDYSVASSRLAATLWESNPAAAVAIYRQTIAIRAEQLRNAPENVEFIRVLAYDLANSANALRRAGNAAEAERNARRAAELDAEMTRRDPVRVECCSDIPLYAIRLADALWDQGKKGEAGEQYRKSVEVAEYYGLRDTCGVFCMKDWATSLESLALWHERMGNPAAAKSTAARADRVWANWVEKNGSNIYIEKRRKELGRFLR